jgi:small-conductance mechanosensitive channel
MKYFYYIFFCIVALSSSNAIAQASVTSHHILEAIAAEKELNHLQKSIPTWSETLPGSDEIYIASQKLVEIRREGERCVEEMAQSQTILSEKITALGESVTGEAIDISQKRKELLSERKQLEQRIAICRLLVLGAKELHGQVQSYRKTAWSDALLTKLPFLWELSAQSFSYKSFMAALKVDLQQLFTWGATSFVILFSVSFPVRRLLRQFAASRNHSTLATLAHYYARRLTFISAALALTLGFYRSDNIYLWLICLAFLLVAAFSPLLELALCQSTKPCMPGRSVRSLLFFSIISTYIIVSIAQDSVYSELLRFLTSLIFLALMLSALRFLFALTAGNDWPTLKSLRIPLGVFLSIGPIASLVGYQALSLFLVRGVYFSLGAAFVIVLTYSAIRSTLSKQQTDAHTTTQDPHEYNHAIISSKTSINIVLRTIWVLLLLLFGYFLLIAWNISNNNMSSLSTLVIDGFQVGAVTVVPGNIVSALLLFILLWLFARWLRQQLGERWLTRTNLDKGTRQSIITLSTYVIIGTAILIVLSIIGVNFQNLAIIAGALSVGIGFGLQNIINNFVSGLILLFERPVRPGDWVVIGATEGYVKHVSIRYTLIQTFDRADVMVPNSELISNQVTNWMLRDSLGRVIVPVGVAYGSDLSKVKDLLLSIASAHPLVITDSLKVSKPKVLFMGFGENSLNFELRCFIKDVDLRLSTRSDLLFTIDDEFRKQNIEIPFPQRVLHMKSDSK